MTWSEFFQKVSIKQPGPSQNKIDSTVLFTYILTISIKRPGLDILEKVSIKQPVLSFFKF
jgi:hypothetical protein